MSRHPYSQRARQKPSTQFFKVEVLLTFTKYVRCAVHVGVDNSPIGKPIQPAMNALPTKRSLVRVLSVIDGNIVQIQETRLRRVRLLLLDVTNPVAFAQIFKSLAQTSEANLCELLVVLLAEVHTTLEVEVVTADNRPDFVFDTEIDDVPRGLANVILYAVVPFAGKIRKPLGLFNPLFVGNALVKGFAFIPPLVD